MPVVDAAALYQNLAPSNVSTFSQAPARGTPPDDPRVFSYSSASDKERSEYINSRIYGLSGSPGTQSASSGPQAGDLVNEANLDAGYTVEIVEIPEIIYTTQDAPSGVVLELSPPYIPDDRIVKYATNRIQVVPSDAVPKARQYAELQNKMRYGYKNGQSVVFPVEYVANEPFSTVNISFGGVMGQFRLDQQNIAFDSTGILVSAEAVFWGGVGE